VEARLAQVGQDMPQKLAQAFKANPLKQLREWGLDNEAISQLGRAALGATLENAPAQYRELADRLKLEDQNASIREEFEAFKRQIAEEKVQDQRAKTGESIIREYREGLTKYVSSPELSKEAPNVAALYAHKPEKTLGMLQDLVARDASAKLRKGGGEPLSQAEAVKALEAELADYAPVFRGSASPEPARVPSQPARPSLSDSAVNPAPASRSTPDPEKDWEAWKKTQEEAWFAELTRKASQ